MQSRKIVRLAPLFMLMAGALSTLLAPATASAGTGGSKVAVVNAAKVFNEIKETKDLKAKMETDKKSLEDQQFQRNAKIDALKHQLETLKSDTPQYAEKQKDLLNASIEMNVWVQMAQADVARTQKGQMKSIFDKITATTAEVATSKGVDIVLAQQSPDWPDNIDQLNVDQLRMIINQKNILFDSAQADLTQDVIAAMDAKYNSGK